MAAEFPDWAVCDLACAVLVYKKILIADLSCSAVFDAASWRASSAPPVGRKDRPTPEACPQDARHVIGSACDRLAVSAATGEKHTDNW